MKSIKCNITRSLFVVMLAVVSLCGGTASAQIRLGVKAGYGINSLSLKHGNLDFGSYVGYSVGLTSEINLPVIGIGVDVSALYTHRDCELRGENDEHFKRGYFEIPVHAKFKFDIFGLNRIAVPFIYAGPDFAFLVDDYDEGRNFKEHKTAISLNLGFGVELMRKLQISANYGYGMTKAFETIGISNGEITGNIEGKDCCWTISAAYFF